MSSVPTAERLAALADFSVDAVVMVNAAGIIQWANPSTLEVLGYQPDDLAGVKTLLGWIAAALSSRRGSMTFISIV